MNNREGLAKPSRTNPKPRNNDHIKNAAVNHRKQRKAAIKMTLKALNTLTLHHIRIGPSRRDERLEGFIALEFSHDFSRGRKAAIKNITTASTPVKRAGIKVMISILTELIAQARFNAVSKANPHPKTRRVDRVKRSNEKLILSLHIRTKPSQRQKYPNTSLTPLIPNLIWDPAHVWCNAADLDPSFRWDERSVRCIFNHP
jgi:hypothetical protein